MKMSNEVPIALVTSFAAAVAVSVVVWTILVVVHSLIGGIMKKFTFELQVTVYADTEDEAREIFCDDPGAWESEEGELLCVAVEDVYIGVEPSSDPLSPYAEDMDFVTVLNQKVNSTG